MFEIGFSEILLIFVLALVVLGPEKLPRVASQVGRWIGRARGMARQFREQLEEEVQLEENRRAQLPPAPQPSAAQPASPPAPAAAPPGVLPPVAIPPAPPQPDPAITYPDTYSHAHPTDSEGRPIEAPPTDSDSPQQDWVGGMSGSEKPAQGAAEAAYARPHERGT